MIIQILWIGHPSCIMTYNLKFKFTIVCLQFAILIFSQSSVLNWEKKSISVQSCNTNSNTKVNKLIIMSRGVSLQKTNMPAKDSFPFCWLRRGTERSCDHSISCHGRGGRSTSVHVFPNFFYRSISVLPAIFAFNSPVTIAQTETEQIWWDFRQKMTTFHPLPTLRWANDDNLKCLSSVESVC